MKITRKNSVLGLAFLAALAVSALMANAATAATDHITAPEPWTPAASAATQGQFESTTGGGKGFTCNSAAIVTSEQIPATADEVTGTPSFAECSAVEGGETIASVFIENGGCDFRLSGETTSGNPTGGEHGTVVIGNHADPGQPCHLELKVTAFKFKCSSIPNQEVEHAGRVEQKEEHLLVKATAHGIESTTTNSIACPTESGGTEVHTNGSLTGNVTLKGHNSNEEPVPLTLTENAT
jgi:hypothetical protein